MNKHSNYLKDYLAQTFKLMKIEFYTNHIYLKQHTDPISLLMLLIRDISMPTTFLDSYKVFCPIILRNL